jgi:hypothetical protein
MSFYPGILANIYMCGMCYEYTMSFNQLIPVIIVLFILLGACISIGFLWCTRGFDKSIRPPPPPIVEPIDAMA